MHHSDNVAWCNLNTTNHILNTMLNTQTAFSLRTHTVSNSSHFVFSYCSNWLSDKFHSSLVDPKVQILNIFSPLAANFLMLFPRHKTRTNRNTCPTGFSQCTTVTVMDPPPQGLKCPTAVKVKFRLFQKVP